jgi:hypothetical protein
MTLTKIDVDALLHALHNWETLQAGIGTCRDFRRKTLERLVRLHLLHGPDSAAVVDYDGYIIEPERYRACWWLTDSGLDRARDEREWRSQWPRAATATATRAGPEEEG